MFPLCTAVTLLAALGISASAKRHLLWPGVAILVITVASGIVYTKEWYPQISDEVAQSFTSGRGYAGLPEYTPLVDNALSMPKNAPLIVPAGWNFQPTSPGGTTVYVEHWSAERKEICADLSHGMTLDLKLLAYPGWRITMDGKPVALRAEGQTGQVQISLPAGPSHTVLQFQRTKDRSLGILISLATAIVLALLEIFARRRKTATETRETELAKAA